MEWKNALEDDTKDVDGTNAMVEGVVAIRRKPAKRAVVPATVRNMMNAVCVFIYSDALLELRDFTSCPVEFAK